MKKYLVLIAFCSIFNTIFSQQIAKNLVVVEITTGTWCQYCPGAAMGADELVAEFGNAVAIIENHGGDSYQNSASVSRINLYGTTGYPTAYFNGTNQVVGGDHDISMYPNYLPVYNSTISVLSSFDISMEITPVNDATYDITVTVDKVHDYAPTNLVAHLVLTESQIQQTWQGMTELNFVNRAMFPSSAGTVLDFSSSNQQIINYTINVDENFTIENCELVAFVQNNTSKEILQGTKESLNIPIGTNNVMISEINYPTANLQICEDAFSPLITIKNRGNLSLSSCTINYQINNEGFQTQIWEGNLAYGDTAMITLDEILYTPLEMNSLEIVLSDPNGTVDDDPSNNSLLIDFNKSAESTSTLYLEIDPGGSFSLPWHLSDSEGTIVYEGNASGNDLITETFNLNFNECYTFTFTSFMGNGIPGGGYFELYDTSENTVYYAAGNSFSDVVTIPFKTSLLADIEKTEQISFELYPNPTHDLTTISLNENFMNYKIIISDVFGSIIKCVIPNDQICKIETKNLSNGIYFVSILFNNKIITTNKMIVND